MKRRMLWLILVACLAAACTPATPAPTPTPAPPLPHSMKGYELYSWQADGQWHFTLITGTNRTKTVAEITTGEDLLTADGWVRIHVQGVEALQTVLSRVPKGEWVFWAGPGWAEMTLGADNDMTLPPQDIIDEVKQHAAQLGLEFHVGQ